MAINFLNNAIFAGDVTVSGGDITVSNAITGVSGGSFRVKNNGGTTIATFADDLNATFAGNVGIGTTDPTAPLHIEGGTNNEVLKIEADVSPFIRWVKSGSDVGFLQFTSTSAYLSNMSNGSFFFRTNNTDKMTITSEGNVGIGTTNPSSLLTIGANGVSTLKPTVIFTDTTNGSSLVLRGQSPILAFDKTGTGVPKILMDAGGLQFKTGTLDAEGDIDMVILPDGNVGIGTTAPTRTLSVEGTAFVRDDLAITVTDPGTNLTKDSQLYLQSKGNQAGNVRASNWFLQTESDSYWGNSGFTISKGYDGGSAVEYLRILSNGNVGINTTSPDFKLDVDGTFGVSDLPFNTDSVSVLVANETLGAELITNGDFATDTAWTKETGWSIGSGVASYNGSATNNALYENLSLTTGATYKLVFTIVNYVSGTLVAALSSGALTGNTPNITANGTYAFDLTATGVLCIFRSTSSFNGSIDNVSVKLITSASNQIQKRELGTGAFGPTPVGAYLPLAGGALTGNLTGTTISLTGGITANTFRTNAGNTDYNLLTRDQPGNTIFVQAAQSNTNQPIAKFSYGSATVNAGTAVLQVSKDNSHFVNCNVGIGTTNPSQKLEVDVASGDGILISSADIATFKMKGGGNANWGFATTNLVSGDFGIYKSNASGGDPISAGTPQLYIKSNGNVGIGTTSPGRKLEVDFTGSVYGAKFTRSDAAGSSLVEFANSAGVKNKIGYDAGIDGFHIGTASATNLVVKQNGNVGIGTTDPQTPLDVAGDIRTTTRYLVDTGTANENMAIGYWDGNNARIEAGSALPMLITSYQGNIKLGINGSTTMVVQSNNVGIGTTSPIGKLNIQQASLDVPSLFIGRFNAENIPLLQIGESDYFTGGTTYGETLIHSSNRDIIISTAQTQSFADVTSAVVTIKKNNGNVGIGTTSPSSLLHLESASSPVLQIKDTTNNVTFKAYAQNSNSHLGNTSNHDLFIDTNNISRVAVKSSGNVGIGVTSPGAKLDVGGNIKVSGSISMFNGATQVLGIFPSGSSAYINTGTSGGTVQFGAPASNVTNINVQGTATATNFILSSDKRLKENIEKVCDNRVKADWKTFELKTEKGEKRYGVIAQELEENHPEFVKTDNEGFKSVKYIDLLIAKIAELEARLEKAGI